MQKIVVLAGGRSSERDVSLRSGAAVVAALTSQNEAAVMCEPEDWQQHAQPGDIIFPMVHGLDGEDGLTQKALTAAGFSFVGSAYEASARCFDKTAYRHFIMGHGLPMAAGAVVSADDFAASPLAEGPYVLKPVHGGSSIDTFIVRDPSTADQAAIAEAFRRNRTMLLETLISGLEITVGVLGSAALPAVEIIPPESGEFDYENKYNGHTQEITPPTHLRARVHAEAQALAVRVHQLTGCRDYSRTDMIVTPTNDLFLLETNTIPGMTGQSLFPKAAAAAGIGFEALVLQLVTFARHR